MRWRARSALRRAVASQCRLRLAARAPSAAPPVASRPLTTLVALAAPRSRHFPCAGAEVVRCYGAGAVEAEAPLPGLPADASGEDALTPQDGVDLEALAAFIDHNGAVAMAQRLLRSYGMYRGANQENWRRAAPLLVDRGRVSKMGLEELKAFIRVMALEVELTIASFWDFLTESIAPTLDTAGIADLMDIAGYYASIRAYNTPVFESLILRVRRERAVDDMPPADLARLLDIFSRAGRVQHLSRVSGQLFNQAQERILEDASAFGVEESFSIVESMARFQFPQVPLLQCLGREVLHPGITSLPGHRVTALCQAYGELGYRHDTVFKSTVSEVLEEHAERQRGQLLGQPLESAVRYSTPDIAILAMALLQLKMYRGNTSWFKWGDKYGELLDILTKRVEDDLLTLEAKPLSAASFVLGRARRGSKELVAAMYARFMALLELGASSPGGGEDPPQYELARFLHGLAMMGPTKKKELDTQELLQWLCFNVDTLVLSDFVRINRHLVAMHCCDKDYLLMLAKDFFSSDDIINMLTKTDIMDLTETYNLVKLTDQDMGRHFFWSMGRRYQKLQTLTMAGKRPQYVRVG